jgi:hypothetical protein
MYLPLTTAMFSSNLDNRRDDCYKHSLVSAEGVKYINPQNIALKRVSPGGVRSLRGLLVFLYYFKYSGLRLTNLPTLFYFV